MPISHGGIGRSHAARRALIAALCVAAALATQSAAAIDLDSDGLEEVGVFDRLPGPVRTKAGWEDVRGLEYLPGTSSLLAVCWHSDDSLVAEIDITTGDFTPLGESGLPRLNSLARDSAGVFHTVTCTDNNGDSSMATIDPSSGAGAMGPRLSPNLDIRALTFGPGDTLYAIADPPASMGNDDLYRIDPDTGAATLVGSTGFPKVQAMAYSPAHDQLFAWDLDSGLLTLDPDTGDATDVGQEGADENLQGLCALPNGVLLGGREALWQVDPETGEVFPPETELLTYRYLVGALAHNPGIGDTLWRTDVAAVVTGGGAADLTLTYHSGSQTITRNTTLDEGATIEWQNVLETLFDLKPDESSSGSLEISSTQTLAVTARTFNQSENGTFGQYLPALTERDALTPGETGILPQIKKNAGFRTNIGAVNLGSASCEAVVRLHDATGSQVGNARTLEMDPYGWTQRSDIFTSANAGTHDVAYATVEVQTGGCLAWIYASVVDAQTGDPTTNPVIVPDVVQAVVSPALPELRTETDFVTTDAAQTPGPQEARVRANQYEGTWMGTTSQNKDVAFHVNSSGQVDDFAIELRLNLGTYYCTGFATPSGPFALDGSSLSTTVTFPASNITSTISGTFSSTTSISGTYSGFSGGFTLICGSTMTIGTGSPLGSGTWQASKVEDVSASASASPTSGQAPVTVQFTGTVSGGVSPYRYHWDFGDGGTSIERSPSHTYRLGGSFMAIFTVTDRSGGSASATVTIEVAPPAPVSASASADVTEGPAPLTVRFSGSAADGSLPYSYSWDFGDGSPLSGEQNPVHTYQNAGEYTAVLTVTDAGGVTATASVAISAGRIRYLLPAVAHAPGAGNTLWRTDVGCMNPGLQPASFTLVFDTGIAKVSYDYSLAAGAAAEWANVAETVFGVSASASTSGSLEILSDQPLVLSARTYNDTPDGTFGQYLPALTRADGITSGQVGVLPQLKKSGDYRTNLGAINLGASECEVRILMFNADGDQLGVERTISAAPGEWVQQNDIFAFTSSGYQPIAYATVEVAIEGCRIWLYASVVDTNTGDPTTIPLLLW